MKEILKHIEKGLLENSDESRRFFHGRGQCYEGLGFINVDWFSPLLLITVYKEPEERDWLTFVAGLSCFREQVDCILVQRRYLSGAPLECLWGDSDNAVAKERDLAFCLQFGGKQNFGFFLDMAPGREWLRARSEGKRVLNLFAYTCSFSVFAIAGGAHSVVNVDMSAAALNVGRSNHRLNGQQERLKRDVDFLSHDLFRSWGKIIRKGPYDLVVIDPPSRQKGSFIASKDYGRVIRRLPELLTEQGEALICLNAPELGDDFLAKVVEENCPALTLVERLKNRDDFPEKDSRRNLKMLHYRLKQ
jgi:23S rRNA (cytosine1962-C5)-methyltransferase